MHSPFAKRFAAALVLGVCLVQSLIVLSPADAAFTTTPKVWDGLTWEPDNSGAPQTSSELNGIAPNDTITVRADVGGAQNFVFADTSNSLGVNAATFASLNSNNSPWVRITYTDNLVGNRDLSLFIGSPGHPNDPRMLVGAYFNNAYTGVLRRSSPAGEVTSGVAAARTNGDLVTITVGQRPDGTIDFHFQSPNLNGGVPVMTQSTYYITQGLAGWDWNQFALRFRNVPDVANGTTVTFNNFEFGNDYMTQVLPEPAGAVSVIAMTGLVALRRRHRHK